MEGTLTFEVEIKGAPEVTIALHLKMHMAAGALVSTKNPKSDWIKGELEAVLYVALEGTPKISL